MVKRLIVLFLLCVSTAWAVSHKDLVARISAIKPAAQGGYTPDVMPAMWWRCDATNSDGSITDASGNGNHGYTTNESASAANVYLTNGCVRMVCPASGEVVAQIGTPLASTLLSNVGAWSITMWHRYNGGNAAPTLRARDVNHGMVAMFPHLRAYHNGVEAATGLRGYGWDTVNTWIFYALSYTTNGTGSMQSYSNLVLLGTDTSGWSGTQAITNGWRIAINTSEDHDLFDIRLHSNALTSAQITNVYWSVTNFISGVAP